MRQAKLFYSYCIRGWNIETVFFFFLTTNRSHCISFQYKSLLGGVKNYKMLATNSRLHGCYASCFIFYLN